MWGSESAELEMWDGAGGRATGRTLPKSAEAEAHRAAEPLLAAACLFGFFFFSNVGIENTFAPANTANESASVADRVARRRQSWASKNTSDEDPAAAGEAGSQETIGKGGLATGVRDPSEQAHLASREATNPPERDHAGLIATRIVALLTL